MLKASRRADDIENGTNSVLRKNIIDHCDESHPLSQPLDRGMLLKQLVNDAGCLLAVTAVETNPTKFTAKVRPCIRGNVRLQHSPQQIKPPSRIRGRAKHI